MSHPDQSRPPQAPSGPTCELQWGASRSYMNWTAGGAPGVGIVAPGVWTRLTPVAPLRLFHSSIASCRRPLNPLTSRSVPTADSNEMSMSYGILPSRQRDRTATRSLRTGGCAAARASPEGRGGAWSSPSAVAANSAAATHGMQAVLGFSRPRPAGRSRSGTGPPSGVVGLHRCLRGHAGAGREGSPDAHEQTTLFETYTSRASFTRLSRNIW